MSWPKDCRSAVTVYVVHTFLIVSIFSRFPLFCSRELHCCSQGFPRAPSDSQQSGVRIVFNVLKISGVLIKSFTILFCMFLLYTVLEMCLETWHVVKFRWRCNSIFLYVQSSSATNHEWSAYVLGESLYRPSGLTWQTFLQVSFSQTHKKHFSIFLHCFTATPQYTAH